VNWAIFTSSDLKKNALGLPDNEQFVCGMALGYADHSKIENTLVTERAPVSAFARFME
jgi:hypothetical protein